MPIDGSNIDAKNWYRKPLKKSSSEMLALHETRKAVPAAGTISEFLPSNRRVKNWMQNYHSTKVEDYLLRIRYVRTVCS